MFEKGGATANRFEQASSEAMALKSLWTITRIQMKL
jgi:hypothetical protein